MPYIEAYLLDSNHMKIKNILLKAILLISLAAISGCAGRSMTASEIAYAGSISGLHLNLEKIRFVKGVKFGLSRIRREILSDENVKNQISKNGTSQNQLIFSVEKFVSDERAIALGNTVFFGSEVYEDDYSTAQISTNRWLMAHEIVHIWQWQNRAVVGYSLGKVFLEHLIYRSEVYEYTLVNRKAFLDYRFEQQAAIVQCYVALRETRPNSAITRRYETLIRTVFPLDKLLPSTPKRVQISVSKAVSSKACPAFQ